MHLTEGPCITQDVILILHINQQPPFSHRHNHLYQQRHIQAGSVKTQAGMLSRGWGGAESPPEDKDCRGHLQTGHCCRWKVKETSQTCVPRPVGSCWSTKIILLSFVPKMEPQASPPVHLFCQDLPLPLTPEPSAKPPFFWAGWGGVLSQFLHRAATCWLRVALQKQDPWKGWGWCVLDWLDFL